MKWVFTLLGAAFALLGALWLLQGTGLVTIDPIACVGECQALEGPSLPWAAAGAALMLVGGIGVWLVWRRR